MLSRLGVAIGESMQDHRRKHWRLAAILITVFVLWSFALVQADVARMSDFGLLSILPLPFYLSLLLLTISFSINVTKRRSGDGFLAVHVAALIVLLFTPPMLLYETVRLPWAWKHIGIVDYILRHGTIDTAIDVEAAYHNWPGFFALIAFVAELTGIERLSAIAKWSPLIGHLALLGILLLVFRCLIEDRRTIWIAIWVYYLANWIGQDYFSPQAFVFPIYLSVIGVVLAFLKASPPPHPKIGQGSLAGHWHLFIQTAVETEPGRRNAASAGWLVLILLVLQIAQTISHQLTPVAMTFSLLALYIFRRMQPLWPFIVAFVLFGLWINWPAGGFMALELSHLQQLAGDVLGNTSANIHDLSGLSDGQRLVAIISRLLTGTVLLLALAGGVMRLFRGRFDVSAALLVLAPFSVLLLHSYDGEGLFRTFMFASPFLAFFVACLLAGVTRHLSRHWGRAVLSTVLFLLAFCWLTAYYGNDNHTRALPGEIQAFRFLAERAPENSLLIEGSPDYPSRFLNYENFTYVSIVNEPQDSLDLVLDDPVDELGLWLDNRRYAATYIILTESQRKGIEALGLLPKGVFNGIKQALLQSDRFDVLFQNEAATIFTLGADSGG